jgi:hypothetical protein
VNWLETKVSDLGGSSALSQKQSFALSEILLL